MHTPARQLFIDDRFVESSSNLTRVMNTPQQPAAPVLTPDRPWEARGIGAYNTVMFEDGRFRMWYAAAMKVGLPEEGAIRLCYAESDDGLSWHKPSLGLVEFQGSADNNIVAPLNEKQSMQGATVVRDERAPAAERYRLWTKFRPTDAELEADVQSGLWAMHSPDGIHWAYDPDQPDRPHVMCDTQNMFFFDDAIGQWVGYTRCAATQHQGEAAEAGWQRHRSIERATSKDFRNWSEGQIVMELLGDDLAGARPAGVEPGGIPVDIYTSCAMKYAHAADTYLAFPAFYYHWADDGRPGTMDVQLMTSRDGVTWYRPGGDHPFLRRGFDGSANGGMIMANPHLIPRADELWLYYAGTGRLHNKAEGVTPSGVFRAVIRRDGFVSLDADRLGGELTTPAINFTGDALLLNIDCGAGGWAQVALRDEAGEAIDGFAPADCDAITANAVSKRVTWRGNGDVSRFAGKPVRLHVTMRDAKLYAFEFAVGG